MVDASALHCRLITFRSDLLGQLAAADRIEPGWLALLAHANAVLGLLDAAEPPADTVLGERVVVIDDGEAIRLAAYAGAAAVAIVELSPARCLTLAQALLAAASRRLGR